MATKTTRRKKRLTAAQWNERYPEGTRVNYWMCSSAVTRGPAYEVAPGVTVVKIEGTFCVTLEAIEAKVIDQ